MNEKEMQELKDYIANVVRCLYCSGIEFYSEQIKAQNKHWQGIPYTPKNPADIFENNYKKIVKHDLTEQEKTNVEKLREFLKKKDEQS